MKIGLYSPYVPTHVGGGEKYFFDVAKILADLGHDVFILLENKVSSSALHIEKIRLHYEVFLGISLEKISFISSPFGSGTFWEKLFFTKKFDVLYLVTDGSLFFSMAKKNIVHIQIPFKKNNHTLIERLKLRNWSIRNSNSIFTQKIVEKSWNVPIQFVHYPMVELPLASFSEMKKEHVILNVGRFFNHLHSKRQDVIVSSFIDLVNQNPKEMKDWKLILIGPAEDLEFSEKVKKMAKGYPVEILHDLNRDQLLSFYERATLYWHAAGFEIDEELFPEKVEHFGISTVEAMNFGCVPLVVGKGGQIEVLGDSLEELLWQSKHDLLKLTLKLIKNSELRRGLAQLAITQSRKFNKVSFEKTIQEMLR